jgi:hypothetical protein
MGGCLSFMQKPDLTGSTFSHYSLNSQSENLDLYPGFRYYIAFVNNGPAEVFENLHHYKQGLI